MLFDRSGNKWPIIVLIFRASSILRPETRAIIRNIPNLDLTCFMYLVKCFILNRAVNHINLMFDNFRQRNRSIPSFRNDQKAKQHFSPVHTIHPKFQGFYNEQRFLKRLARSFEKL